MTSVLGWLSLVPNGSIRSRKADIDDEGGINMIEPCSTVEDKVLRKSR